MVSIGAISHSRAYNCLMFSAFKLLFSAVLVDVERICRVVFVVSEPINSWCQ